MNKKLVERNICRVVRGPRKALVVCLAVVIAILILFAVAMALSSPPSEEKTDIQPPIAQPEQQGEAQIGQESAPSKETGKVKSSVALKPTESLFLVTGVIDGDTIEIEGGKRVRYIGIDTPETDECFNKEATKKNKELVEGKEVKLEKDISETDKYGRLLRYVWVGSTFVNDYLVRQGYANASSYPPDVKYQDQFRQAEQEGRENSRGLWGDACKTESTAPPPPAPTPPPSSPKYTCDCSKTCTQMSSCEEAYYQLNTCGCSRRDGDKDGVPCENICPGG